MKRYQIYAVMKNQENETIECLNEFVNSIISVVDWLDYLNSILSVLESKGLKLITIRIEKRKYPKDIDPIFEK